MKFLQEKGSDSGYLKTIANGMAAIHVNGLIMNSFPEHVNIELNVIDGVLKGVGIFGGQCEEYTRAG